MNWLRNYKEENELEDKVSLFLTCSINSFVVLVGIQSVFKMVVAAMPYYNNEVWSNMDFSNPEMVWLFVKANFPFFLVPPVIFLVLLLFSYMAVIDYKKLKSMIAAESNANQEDPTL